MAKVVLTASDTSYTVASGNNSELIGLSDAQTITVQAGATANLTGDFTGDNIVLPGNAGNWTMVRSGATVTLVDSSTGTTVQVAASTAVTTLTFDDGARDLAIDSEAGTVNLGTEVVTETESTVGATDPASYTLTAGAESVDEGATATFTLATTDVAEGTEVAYTITGVAAEDVDGGSLTGTATVAADGTATISVALLADKATEGAETLTVSIDGSSASASSTVNDTSLNADASKTFTLTKGIDDGADFVGGTGDDIFEAKFAENVSTGLFTVETLNALDVLDGGDGNDVLNYYTDDGIAVPATSISNIETLNIISGAGVTVDTSPSLITGVTTITAQSTGTGNAANIDTSSDVTSVTLTGSSAAVDIDDAGTGTGSTADKLAAVSVTGNAGALTVDSDALTSLSLANTNQNATVTAAAGTRTLAVTLDKVTGGTIQDNQATTLEVNTTGTKSSGVTLTAGAATAVTVNANTDTTTAADKTFGITDINANVAKTLTVTGDSTVTIGATTAVAALTTIDASASTGGLTITPALATTVALTGGAGKENISLAASHAKAVATGAGDDTVTMAGAVTTGGSVDAGEGTDILSMTAANAATVSATTTFENGISNFEKLSIAQATAPTAINLANMDDISYVVSAGVAANAGQVGSESSSIVFNDLTLGQSVTVAGLTVTATGGSLTKEEVAELFDSNGTAAGIVGNATVSGALANFTSADTSTDTVVFTSSQAGNVTDITMSEAGVATPAALTPSITQGTAGSAAVAEVFTVQFSGFATGADTIAFDGATATLTDGDNINLIATAVNAAGATTSWGTPVNNGNGSVTYTQATPGAVTDVTTGDFTITDVGAAGAPTISSLNVTTQGADAVSAATEFADFTFVDLSLGQSVTIAGLTVTATNGTATAQMVEDAFSTGATATNAVVSGSLTGYTSAEQTDGSVTRFTSTSASTNVTDLTATVAGAAAPTAASVTTTQGSNNALSISNMANSGTVELTGTIQTASEVVMKDATGSADVLNLKLNGTANLVNTAATTIANVETINIEATDSSSDTTTLTNPAAASTVLLNAAGTTTINLTGNHGVDFTGSTLSALTTLDASGITSVGNAAGASATQIATTGAVTLSTQVTNKAVTITTGNGADIISTASVNDATFLATNVTASTISTGDGNDTITGSAGMDVINGGAGNDTITGGSKSDNLTGGTGNDVFVLASTNDSVLIARDIITDFSANTYGQGTAGAVTSAGATTTSASWTGDVINLTAIKGTSTSLDVDVFNNAGDAQTFLQNNATNNANVAGIALDTSTGYLYIDVNDDGTADSVIELTGISTINEAAFLLSNPA